ncbi:NusG domain II-containing protein [Clostridia bacterium]|nr:NusG domain II-containing protein [Clostridia bacterium]
MSSLKAIRHMLNRWDLGLILLILVVALSLFVWQQRQPDNASQVRVSIDGTTSYLLNLSQDQVQSYDTMFGSITVEIKDGQVRVLQSSCDEQICVHQGFIHEPGASIVCIPNRTIVECLGTTQYDGVSR